MIIIKTLWTLFALLTLYELFTDSVDRVERRQYLVAVSGLSVAIIIIAATLAVYTL